MKIIITGATGFVGRNLAERLHGDGEQVLATGRSLTVGQELTDQGIDFQPADLLDLERLSSVFSPADCVIHCAALPGDWGAYRDFYQTNVVGTRNVADVCLRHGIGKIIFVSTPSIYFSGEDRLDISEADPLPASQRAYYGKTKLQAEAELRQLQDRALQVIIFRPRAVYGPHDDTILPRILRMAEKRRFPLINGGRALVDITFVGNLVDVVCAGLSAPDSAWNETYNISNGSPIQIRDWFEQVLALFGRPFRPREIPERAAWAVAGMTELASRLPFGPRKPALTRFSVGYMAKSMTLSIDKARRKLGYVPRFSNQEGFERYADWYRKRTGAGHGDH